MSQTMPPLSPPQIALLLERAGIEPLPGQLEEIAGAYARLAVLVQRLRTFDLQPADEPLPTYRPDLRLDR